MPKSTLFELATMLQSSTFATTCPNFFKCGAHITIIYAYIYIYILMARNFTKSILRKVFSITLWYKIWWVKIIYIYTHIRMTEKFCNVLVRWSSLRQFKMSNDGQNDTELAWYTPSESHWTYLSGWDTASESTVLDIPDFDNSSRYSNRISLTGFLWRTAFSLFTQQFFFM